MKYSEDFLNYVWQFKSFDFSDFKTAAGENLKIIHQGFLKTLDRILIMLVQLGDTIGVGNVEIHLKSSDWLKHNH